MLVNLFSDVHGNTAWFDFIYDRSKHADATIIAGDVLYAHDEALSEKDKVSAFLRLALKLENSGHPTCFTSGNHDLNDVELLDCLPLEIIPGLPAFRSHGWMGFPSINGFGFVHSYCSPLLIRDVLLLALPWVPWEGLTASAADEIQRAVKLARYYADSLGVQFILIHHEEPESSFFMEALVRSARPDLFVCGHKHAVCPKAGPIAHFGSSAVFNSGQDLSSPTPWYGILDTDERSLQWHFSQDGDRKSSTFSIDPTTACFAS